MLTSCYMQAVIHCPKKLNKNCFTANYFKLFHEKVCKGWRRSRLQLPQVPNPAEITGKSFSYRMLSLVLKLVIKKENPTYKFPK